MRSSMKIAQFVVIGACALGARDSVAVVIVEHPSAVFQQNLFIPGQSFLTPGP